METKAMNVNLSRNKKLERMIMLFFKKSGSCFECNECSKLLRGYQFILKQHLKMHHKHLWEDYLLKVKSEMLRTATPSVDSSVRRCAYLKCSVCVQTKEGGQLVLSMPESRITRETCSTEDLAVSEHLVGFKGRIQKEYNTDPIGPYMGPFDQSKQLSLKLQLPQSELSYRRYTEFRHEETVGCQSFSIDDSYDDVDDLEKIKSLKINVAKCGDANKCTNEKILYTCRKGTCEIPCMCKDCCKSEPQCKMHRIRHEEVFNYEEDSMTIRSSELLFRDSTFLTNSYTVRYANIPVQCPPCAKDLLHHNLYHIKYHEVCKFCLQIRHKLKATFPKTFHREIKMHQRYLDHICPYCDKDFVEKRKKNQHIEYAHGGIRLSCSECNETFASKQALDYHDDVTHKKVDPVKCDQCESSFSSIISLKNHQKFNHSSFAKIPCKFCDTQFKQKKDLMFHLRNKHMINTDDHFMNDWNSGELRRRYQCDLCECSYKYKKDLTKHKKKTRMTSSDSKENDELFQCDLCSSAYKDNKGLNEHKRNKHEGNLFSCRICEKSFNQKSNCLKHERNQHND